MSSSVLTRPLSQRRLRSYHEAAVVQLAHLLATRDDCGGRWRHEEDTEDAQGETKRIAHKIMSMEWREDMLCADRALPAFV